MKLYDITLYDTFCIEDLNVEENLVSDSHRADKREMCMNVNNPNKVRARPHEASLGVGEGETS